MPISNGKQRKYDEAIASLMSSKTVAEAAAKVGISHATLTRWLKLPEFIERYDSAKSQLMTATVNKLRDVAFESVELLSAIARDKNTLDGARVTALRTLIEFSMRGDEQEFIKNKLTELEQKTNSSAGETSGWIE